MHIMSRTCQKLQLCALVGRLGSKNAMVGRLDDLGAGRGTGREKAKKSFTGVPTDKGEGLGIYKQKRHLRGSPRKLR